MAFSSNHTAKSFPTWYGIVLKAISALNSPCLGNGWLFLSLCFLWRDLINYCEIIVIYEPPTRCGPEVNPKPKKNLGREITAKDHGCLSLNIFLLHKWHQLKPTATTSFIIIKFISFFFDLRDELKTKLRRSAYFILNACNYSICRVFLWMNEHIFHPLTIGIAHLCLLILLIFSTYKHIRSFV